MAASTPAAASASASTAEAARALVDSIHIKRALVCLLEGEIHDLAEQLAEAQKAIKQKRNELQEIAGKEALVADLLELRALQRLPVVLTEAESIREHNRLSNESVAWLMAEQDVLCRRLDPITET